MINPSRTWTQHWKVFALIALLFPGVTTLTDAQERKRPAADIRADINKLLDELQEAEREESREQSIANMPGSERLTPWQDARTRGAAMMSAKERVCAAAVKSLPGIADAEVVIHQRSEWERNLWARRGAEVIEVFVEHADNKPVPAETIGAIGRIVAAVFGITNNKGISIVDVKHSRFYDGAGEEMIKQTEEAVGNHIRIPYQHVLASQERDGASPPVSPSQPAKTGREIMPPTDGQENGEPVFAAYPLAMDAEVVIHIIRFICKKAHGVFDQQSDLLLVLGSKTDHENIRNVFPKLEKGEESVAVIEGKEYVIAPYSTQEADMQIFLSLLRVGVPQALFLMDYQSDRFIVIGSKADHEMVKSMFEQIQKAKETMNRLPPILEMSLAGPDELHGEELANYKLLVHNVGKGTASDVKLELLQPYSQETTFLSLRPGETKEVAIGVRADKTDGYIEVAVKATGADALLGEVKRLIRVVR